MKALKIGNFYYPINNIVFFAKIPDDFTDLNAYIMQLSDGSNIEIDKEDYEKLLTIFKIVV